MISTGTDLVINLTIAGLWTVSGIIGGIFRLFLLRKYLTDYRVAKRARMNGVILSIPIRGIQATLIHLLIKLIVIAFGVNAIVLYLHIKPTEHPAAITVIAFLAIPWLLTWDGYLEHVHQKSLLRSVLKRIKKERR